MFIIKKIYARIIHELIRVRSFIFLLSDFNFKDSFVLAYFKMGDARERFIYLKPKKWLHDIKIRDSYRDKRTLKDVFLPKYHLPPKTIKLKKDSIVLDLGCNTGLTIAHLKNLFPEIKVFGYEMDVDNFLLAQRNTKAYNDIHLFNKAIWIDNSSVEYFKHSGFDGYSLNIVSKTKENMKVKGITMSNIIEEHQLDKIDYMKMDIEGSEKDILNHHDLSWLKHVNAMNIEMHLTEEENIDDYIRIIKKQGFNTWKDTNHISSIIAVKK